MPKQRRGGRKYQVRRVKAQLYQTLPTHGFLHYLGVEGDYAVADKTEALSSLPVRVSDYKLVPIIFHVPRIRPSDIPAEDPRFAAYTTRPSTEKDVPEHIPYKLVRISVGKRPVDVTHISKEDPRYEFYASKNRVSAWINSQYRTVNSECLESREE